MLHQFYISENYIAEILDLMLSQHWQIRPTSVLFLKWLILRCFQEIDYTKEAANAELFASNFKDLDYVKVPAIYWEYTTPQVYILISG